MTYFDAGPGLPYSAFLNLPKSSAHVRIPKVSWQSDSVRIVHGIRTVKAGDARLAEVGDATETEASGVAWNLMKRLQMFADQIHAIRFKTSQEVGEEDHHRGSGGRSLLVEQCVKALNTCHCTEVVLSLVDFLHVATFDLLRCSPHKYPRG